ncbi:MAG TPA: DUF5674 family protein [Candidatus Eisenbacteria bacterium]
MPSDIHIISQRIAPDLLERLVRESFGNMVKYVVDVERGAIAIGGEFHADAEGALLESGAILGTCGARITTQDVARKGVCGA